MRMGRELVGRVLVQEARVPPVNATSLFAFGDADVVKHSKSMVVALVFHEEETKSVHLPVKHGGFTNRKQTINRQQAIQIVLVLVRNFHLALHLEIQTSFTHPNSRLVVPFFALGRSLAGKGRIRL